MRLAFDTETNGLLIGVTKMHCLVAIDIDTDEVYTFGPGDDGWIALFDKADVLVAHNAFGYDMAVLKKLFEYNFIGKVYCTKVMSQVLNYNRFKNKRHNLATWGKFLGFPKIKYGKKKSSEDDENPWEYYDDEMLVYCIQDTRIVVEIFKWLIKNELRKQVKAHPALKFGLRNEHEMDRIMSDQILNGWLFDREGAERLLNEIHGKMRVMEDEINPKLRMRVKAKDKKDGHFVVKEITKVRIKNGNYTKWVSDWFNIPRDSDVDSPVIVGDFMRIEFIQPDIGNIDSVKHYLYELGWTPDEWNWEKDGYSWRKKSEKLSDSSLKPLGRVGEIIMNYYTLRSRASIMAGWFPHIDEETGRLHGDVFSIGTPTFRQRHKIIANLPGPKAEYGPQMRGLFIARPGYKLVSADSAGCQLRLLAHYMKDDDFTFEVLDGDIHQKNADILGCTRPQAKPFIFAFLYGAGGKKLGEILGVATKIGQRLKTKFTNSYPVLKKLINKIKKILEIHVNRYSEQFVWGLDGRKVFIDSAFKGLNYTIQSAEAIVMKYTVVMADDMLKAEGLDTKVLLFYHDECTWEVREDQASRAREIIMQCFEEAPKQVGVEIMTCGDCKIGDDYYEVH